MSLKCSAPRDGDGDEDWRTEMMVGREGTTSSVTKKTRVESSRWCATTAKLLTRGEVDKVTLVVHWAHNLLKVGSIESDGVKYLYTHNQCTRDDGDDGVLCMYTYDQCVLFAGKVECWYVGSLVY